MVKEDLMMVACDGIGGLREVAVRRNGMLYSSGEGRERQCVSVIGSALVVYYVNVLLVGRRDDGGDNYDAHYLDTFHKLTQRM